MEEKRTTLSDDDIQTTPGETRSRFSVTDADQDDSDTTDSDTDGTDSDTDGTDS